LVSIRLASLKQTKFHEYFVRFVFGGTVTVMAGLVAERFGSGAGGLFLAFPAIFPATVTLIEAHEKRRKANMGHDGTKRGRMAASLDAAGAVLGCVGLAGFAITLRLLLPGHNGWFAVFTSLATWVVVSIALWELRRSRLLRFLR